MTSSGLQEATLVSGAVVRCRPVPPYTLDLVVGQIPEPDYPYVDVSGKRSTETRPALAESPEWIEYQKRQRDYKKRLTEAIQAHQLQFGIVSWKLPDTDVFVKMPPDEWEVPTFLSARYGVETAEDSYERRLQFIKYELIQYDVDDVVIAAITSNPVAPLTKKELKDGLVPFDSSDGTEPPKSQSPECPPEAKSVTA